MWTACKQDRLILFCAGGILNLQTGTPIMAGAKAEFRPSEPKAVDRKIKGRIFTVTVEKESSKNQIDFIFYLLLKVYLYWLAKKSNETPIYVSWR